MKITIFCKDGSIQTIFPSEKCQIDLIDRKFAEDIVGPSNFWKMTIEQV